MIIFSQHKGIHLRLGFIKLGLLLPNIRGGPSKSQLPDPPILFNWPDPIHFCLKWRAAVTINPTSPLFLPLSLAGPNVKMVKKSKSKWILTFPLFVINSQTDLLIDWMVELGEQRARARGCRLGRSTRL